MSEVNTEFRNECQRSFLLANCIHLKPLKRKPFSYVLFRLRFLTMNELPPMMTRHLFRHRARRQGIKIHSNGRNELAFEGTGRQR